MHACMATHTRAHKGVQKERHMKDVHNEIGDEDDTISIFDRIKKLGTLLPRPEIKT